LALTRSTLNTCPGRHLDVLQTSTGVASHTEPKVSHTNTVGPHTPASRARLEYTGWSAPENPPTPISYRQVRASRSGSYSAVITRRAARAFLRAELSLRPPRSPDTVLSPNTVLSPITVLRCPEHVPSPSRTLRKAAGKSNFSRSMPVLGSPETSCRPDVSCPNWLRWRAKIYRARPILHAKKSRLAREAKACGPGGIMEQNPPLLPVAWERINEIWSTSAAAWSSAPGSPAR